MMYMKGNKSIDRMSNNLFIPDEMMVEILHRLPAKTLVRCTIVCKTWRSLINHPFFVSLHNRQSPSTLLVTSPSTSKHSLHHDDAFLTHSSYLSLPSSPYSLFANFAICNGLICMSINTGCSRLIICNPSVRRFLCLPQPRHHPPHSLARIALAFDSNNSDYKVLRIAPIADAQRFGIFAPAVDLYSLVAGIWRNLDSIAPVCHVEGNARYAFVHGIVHWLAIRRETHAWYYFVLSFHFEHELFREVLLPPTLAHRDFSKSSAPLRIDLIGDGSAGNTLYLYHVTGYDSPFSCCIWAMKEYGVVESWYKLFSFNLRGFCLEEPSSATTMLSRVLSPPVAFLRMNSGEMLLGIIVSGKRCSLYLLDMETQKIKDLQIELDSSLIDSDYYSESLVLLNKASGAMPY